MLRKTVANHCCHAIGCHIRILPKFFMCIKHWRMLPKPHKDAIWQNYVLGQEVTKNPTIEYLEAAELARLALFRIEYCIAASTVEEARDYLRKSQEG